MKKLFFLFFIIAIGQNLLAQTAERAKKTATDSLLINNNQIYISLSPLNQMFIYEHNFHSGRRSDFNFRVGYGLMFGIFGDKNQGGLLNLGLITNNDGKHHFEMQGGASVLYSYETQRNAQNSPYMESSGIGDYLYFYPSFYLGYRIQKPNKPFVFRFGTGYPETFALSFGFSY